MQTLSSNGAGYRTRPMSQDRAEQFARCLAANPRFEGVVVLGSRSPGKSVVVYRPANLGRQAELLDDQQNTRAARADAEGGNYVFAANGDGRWWCLSTSGETYLVSLSGCDCPDHTYRCGAAGLACKHMLALASNLGRQVTFAPVTPAPQVDPFAGF